MQNTTSDLELARLVVDGDSDAALELFMRYEPIAKSMSRMNPEDVNGLYSPEDAYQDCFVAMYEAAAALLEKPQFGFPRHFKFAAGDAIRMGKNKARGDVVVPLTMYKRVVNAVKELGDEHAARQWLAEDAPASIRMTPETFDAVWYWSFGRRLEWGDAAAKDLSGEGESLSISDVVADESALLSFQAIEDREAVLNLLENLPEKWQEVLVRLYGLKGYGEHTSQAVASVMGMHAAAVRRIHSKALARLQMVSDLPAHYTPKDETKRVPLKSTVGGNRQDPPTYNFPVTVRYAS